MLIAWVAVMAVLVNRSYVQATGNLATDLARYGSSAQWRGVYYRGEKLGFTVSQTVPVDDGEGGDEAGFELQEDGQLQMTLLGAHTITTLRTTARVNRAFELQSFEFSLDPGTGPIAIGGVVRDLDLHISITSGGRTRTEVRRLPERPMLTLNLVRRLADEGLTPGSVHQWNVFDPATLRNAPVTVKVGEREIVRSASTPIPAFRVEMEFTGLKTTAWITDTGEIVREESPLGFIIVREPQERARALAIDGRIRQDLLDASAVVPVVEPRSPPLPPIDDPRNVRRLRMRVEGADLSSPDLQGAGQRVDGNIVEITDAQTLVAGPADDDLARYLSPEPFIESDDPDIRAAAEEAVGRRSRHARAGGSADALRECHRAEKADRQPAVRARGAADPHRRLQRAHGAVCRHVESGWDTGADCRRPRVRPRRVLLPRLAGDLHRRRRRARILAAGRSHVQPVSGRRHAFPARARRPRQAGGDYSADRPRQDHGDRSGSRREQHGRFSSDGEPSIGAPIALPPSRRQSRWCLPCFLGGHQ